MVREQSEPQAKRSAALPITLVLLVFSLIGNVFLYSLYLQDTQDRKYEKGQHVAFAATETASFYNAALQGIESLLEHNDSERRAIDKFSLGMAFGHVQGVLDLIGMARELNGKAESDTDDIYRYFADIENKLRTIGGGSGELTEEETAYLMNLQTSFGAQKDIILKFNFDAAEIRSASIRLGGGFGWLDIADELERAIAAEQANTQ